MSLSNLALTRPPSRTSPLSINAPVGRVVTADTTRPPAATTPVVEQTKPPPLEHLTVDAARALSIDTVNLLVRENPGLVARMVTDAGRRRRAELPPSMTPLSSQARAILLCGDLRRGRQLAAADSSFLDAYLESIGAS